MRIETFEDYINCFIAEEKNNTAFKCELMERTDSHFKFRQGENSIVTYYNESELTTNLKLKFPNVLFVKRFELYTPQFDYVSDPIYILHFTFNGGRLVIDIDVNERNVPLTFNIRTKDAHKTLADAFLLEIKKLNRYRLITITQ